MSARLKPPPAAPLRRRLEAWLWTGPIGHLVGGSLDVVLALVRHRLAHARDRGSR